MSSPSVQYTQFSHIFGRENYSSDVMGLVKVISHESMPKSVAVPSPVSSFKSRESIARPWEYKPPRNVDDLDARFSNEEYGSGLYKRAKSILFDLEAIKPRKSRKVQLKDGSIAEVHDYRPWLSHWLIRGLADLSEYDERLQEAGIVPGDDLEAKLVYNSGMDFSGVQYKVMTNMLKELVENAHAEQGTPTRGDDTLHDYLTGKITTPLLVDWELLNVFGEISEGIQEAAESKNRGQFENQEGLYWAVRIFDVWRSAYRKQHAPSREPDNHNKHNSHGWDYLPVAEGYKQLTEGVLERIDNDFDWVTIGNITQVNRQDGHDLGQTGNERMFVYRPGPNEPVPDVIVKTPYELWLDYVGLTDVLNGIMGRYLKKKGETIRANSANNILGSTDTAINGFYSHHFNIISPFTQYDFSRGASKSKEISNDAIKKCVQQTKLLTKAIEDGTFEQEFNIPAGTIEYMLVVVRSLGSHIPEELSKYIARNRQITILNRIINEERTNVNKTIDHSVELASMGIDARNNRGLKNNLDRLEKTDGKYAKRCKETYGADVFESGVGKSISLSRFCSSVLSTYGLDSLQSYVSFAVDGVEPITEKYKKPILKIIDLTSTGSLFPPTIIKIKSRSQN